VGVTVTVPDAAPSSTSDADDGLDRRIVRTDLGVACATLVTATLLSTTADSLLPTGWWVVPLVALGWALLTAASDRYRAGFYALFGAGFLALLGIVRWVVNGSDPLPILPLLLYGLGLGSAANRLLFGVVRPVPALRRERETS
jgi:hypothetical protein